MLKKLLLICLILLSFSSVTFANAGDDLRVALVYGQYSAEISCDDEFTVEDLATGKVSTIPQGKYFLNVKDGKLTMGEQAFGEQITINRFEGKSLPQINKRRYAGSLVAKVQGDRLLINNVVNLELYLCSVLPSKTMPIWPDEAIKAQAIAARSYAQYMMWQNQNSAYDITANDKELAYQGTGAEKAAISKFIKATAGQILVDNAGNPVQAVTTSSTGGRTASAKEVWGREVSYLQSVEDYDSDSPEYKWEYHASPIMVRNFLEQNGYAVGKLESIRLSLLEEPDIDRSATGRVNYLIIAGDAGVVKVSGLQLMQLLSLNSTLFDVETGVPVPDTLNVPITNYYGMQIGSKDINIKVKDQGEPVWKNVIRSYHLLSGGKEEKITFRGKGKGEGVGLSVWGARGMANASSKNTYKKILAHYYPNTSLVK
ncbi:MAG: SpoIID/LytB domain-containing protein [Phascolarctobacterium sp.]|nr:SpoIID/LytB domain-containing protein [Phascolarctobacterium sp.]